MAGPNSTTARVFLRSGRGPPEVRASNLGRPPGEEMGFYHHPFFNYQTARRGEEATLLPLSLRTLTTYRGLWRYFYKTVRGLARAHATKLYGDFLLSLYNQTPMTTTTTAAAAAFFNIIITHLLHSHIHCNLNHSCSKLTSHDLHLFLNPRKPHLPPPREIFPSSSTSNTVDNTDFFKSPANSFQTSRPPREGREVT